MRITRNIYEAAAAPAQAGCEDVRCGCGSLVARVVGDEVELKCRRCKRVWRLALAGAQDEPLPGGEPSRKAARRWRLAEGTRR